MKKVKSPLPAKFSSKRLHAKNTSRNLANDTTNKMINSKP